MAKPTTVSYEQLVNTGNYENYKIGVTFAVEDDGDLASAMALAREFVQDEIDREQRRRVQASMQATRQRAQAPPLVADSPLPRPRTILGEDLPF